MTNYKNKLLIGSSVLALGFLINPLLASGATCTGSQTREVRCLDYRGQVVASRYCSGNRSTGTRPITSQSCSYSCGGGGGGGSDRSDNDDRSGGHEYVDTDGDGITDTRSVDAPPGEYQGGSSLGGAANTDPNEITTVSERGNLAGGTSTVVGGSVNNGINDHEWDPNGGSGGSSSGGSSGGGGCFVTTASVEVMGEADNGPTLSKLRHLRDFYTIHNYRGAERIQIYYDVAPKIVEKINSLENSQSVWKDIYSHWINPISSLIDNDNFQEADRLYADMVIDLAWKYVMKDLKPDQRKNLFLHTFRIYQA